MFMTAASSCKAVLAPSCTASTLHGATMTEHSKSGVKLIIPRNRDKYFAAEVRRLRKFRTAAAFEDVPAAADPGNVEVTWQIVVGALAGVTPFVVAGIEFSKRIIAQRRCEVCGGSGLVLREKYQFRCPGCGGFLPWQSWKRFFSG